MGNTNFQTIHQMGTAISNMVKQATGRDNVQNIDMEHVTVAQNHRYEEVDISGRVVSFQAGEAGLPFEKLDVQINPVQYLHGYDAPWPAGGGKNILPFIGRNETKSGITVSYDESDQIYILNGTTTSQMNIDLSVIPREQLTLYNAPLARYVMSVEQVSGSMTIAEGSGNTFAIAVFNDAMNDYFRGDTSKTSLTNYYGTAHRAIDTTNAYHLMIQLWRVGTVLDNVKLRVQIVNTADSAELWTAWTPYSNICPITGWTMVNVYQSGQNMEDARVYRFTFPSEAGIVYGGSLTINDDGTGTLVVDRAEVDLGALNYGIVDTNRFYNTLLLTNFKRATIASERKTGIVCEMFKPSNNASYSSSQDDNSFLRGQSDSLFDFVIKDTAYSNVSEFKTAMSGVQLVYELATPITYQLTPQEISTLLGQNYIWADTGDIEVKFTNVKELY